MGVSRSRDDYRLGEPVIQDISPSSAALFFFAFLLLERDGETLPLETKDAFFFSRRTGGRLSFDC